MRNLRLRVLLEAALLVLWRLAVGHLLLLDRVLAAAVPLHETDHHADARQHHQRQQHAYTTLMVTISDIIIIYIDVT